MATQVVGYHVAGPEEQVPQGARHASRAQPPHVEDVAQGIAQREAARLGALPAIGAKGAVKALTAVDALMLLKNLMALEFGGCNLPVAETGPPLLDAIFAYLHHSSPQS